jgi:hypothetical protein
MNIVKVFRWLARLGSLTSTGLILFFFFGEGFDPSHILLAEWVGLAFFPFGVVAGILLGWWKEGWGGALAVASLLDFYAIYGSLIHHALPGGRAIITRPFLHL